jgi:NADPH:quinone reductase-like Zn-dependent oxidoreductase
MVIRLGKLHGFRTLNAVRRREQIGELLGLGADAVVCTSDENLHRRVMELTNGEGVRYAIDAVGGSTGSEVIGTLARNGRLLVYGTLAAQPLTIDPRVLLVGRKRIEGFWLSEWVRDAGVFRMLLLLRQLNKLIRSGVLGSEVSATYPITEVHTACKQAALPGRPGKVLLRLS